jgi:hypothetical protein
LFRHASACPAINFCTRPHRMAVKYAHAGSRTRVTSMGGLYDAVTLHALCAISKNNAIGHRRCFAMPQPPPSPFPQGIAQHVRHCDNGSFLCFSARGHHEPAQNQAAAKQGSTFVRVFADVLAHARASSNTPSVQAVAKGQSKIGLPAVPAPQSICPVSTVLTTNTTHSAPIIAQALSGRKNMLS